ncbi:MAG: hypothetical protein JWN53_1551 [Gemmatimonadetes bacterium]|nr:hypothetical protein [Gemmatimonadota bacterium]
MAIAFAARADECSVVESRSSLAQLSGARIASIDVVADGPELPGFTERFAGLHPVSRAGTIRRQLLFAAGDTVDTLLVGETMRRLRRQRLFSDAVIQARQCEAAGGVALVVRTRDSWTLRPTARLRTPSTISLGVEEKNFLGTGRAVAVASEMTSRGAGASLSLSDPWLFGSDISGSMRLANLAGTHTTRANLRNHEYSVFDEWRMEGSAARLSYGDTSSTDKALHTLNAMVLVGRRVGGASRSVTMLTLGGEFDSAAGISASRRMVIPGTPHVRSFLGADVGVIQRTAVFDTASWVVPGRGFLDVPLGWEGDAVVGGGWQREAEVPALKLDGWIGRVWLPRRGDIVMFDAWASGYVGRGIDANHIARLATSWYGQTTRGMWGARLIAERLLELDPDLRQLSLMPTADYTAPAVRPYAARGGRTLAASFERTMHLFTIGAASVMDAGTFAAASYRWNVEGVPTVASDQLRAGVVGARLRLLSANGAVNSVRVDVGYPVMLSPELPRRAFAVLTIGTLFDVSRQRDGRRLY